MPGESILVVDDSLAVQDIAQSALYSAGYHVTTASNGTAALTFPGLEEINLVILDADMDGLPGRETTRILKQNGPTHPVPVMLLVPEDWTTRTESIALGGACAYLVKPFDPQVLVRKVEQIFEQQRLDELSRQYLSDAADRVMVKLADQQIAAAVERKTQLIVERCIQSITMTVDQRARGLVDEHVTQLVSEKEQDLVRLTVREVAQSMVEKLAATKVEEAMEAILAETTDRTVRGTAEKMLPGLIRDKVRDTLGTMLPREVETRLQKAAEKMVPELSQQLVETIEGVAKRIVPKAAREHLPAVVESQVGAYIEQNAPRRVAEYVARELERQLPEKLEPTVRQAAARIRLAVVMVNSAIGLCVLAGMAVMFWLTFFRK